MNKTTFSLVLLIAFLYIGIAPATADTFVGGPITTNTTWTLVGSPYIVTSNVTVNSGITLTIEAGVLVKFDGLYAMNVSGVLNAQGTALSPITFTSGSLTPAPQNWNSIHLIGSESSNSQIAYWVIQYSVYGLYLDTSSPTVTQVSSSNNTYGFFLDGSFSTLTSVTASNNQIGCYLDHGSSPTITQSTSSNNQEGVFITSGASATVNYSKLINNATFGIRLYRTAVGPDPTATVNRSSLYGNGRYAVYLDSDGTPYQNPNAVLNFKENWWGTTDRNVIILSNYDHARSASLPYVNHLPYLDGENGNIALTIYDVSVTSDVIDPFMGQTSSIHYSMTRDANVTVKIYAEATHSLVRTLVNDVLRAVGTNSEIWDGRDDSSAIAGPGVYYFTIEAHDELGHMETFNDPNTPLMGPPPYAPGLTVDSQNFDPYRNDLVKIHYTLYNNVRLSLSIFILNPYPSPIHTLVNNELRLSGENTEHWDGRLSNGSFHMGDFYFSLVPNVQPLPLYAIIIHQPSHLDVESLRTEAYLILPIYGEVSTAHYTLNRTARVTLEIQDPNGSHFKTLVNDVLQVPGPQSVEWNGKDDSRKIASLEGAYRIILTAVDPVTGQSMQRVGTTMVYR